MAGESTVRDPASTQSDPLFEESDDPNNSDSSQTNPDEGSTDGQGSGDIVIRPGEGARDFTNPLLKGKSVEEVERILQAQQDLIRQQNQELNSRVSTGTREERAPAPEDDDPGYGEHFLAPDLKKMEDRLSRRLQQMVEPLQSHAATNRNEATRTKLRGGLKHFALLEPSIDQILRQQGKNPSEVSESDLTILYHTAVGLAHEQGVPLDSAPAPRREDPPARREEIVTDIPQRRPSSAPLPENRATPKLRQLSENEKRLAREYRMTDAEYIAEMDKPDDEVVTPGFSKDRW